MLNWAQTLEVSLPPFILWKKLIPLITQTGGLTFYTIILHGTAFFGFHSKTFIIANVQSRAGMLDLCSIQVSPWKIAWSWKNPCLLYKCLPWDPSRLFLPAYVWKEIKLRLWVSDHIISENASAWKHCVFVALISTCCINVCVASTLCLNQLKFCCLRRWHLASIGESGDPKGVICRYNLGQLRQKFG